MGTINVEGQTCSVMKMTNADTQNTESYLKVWHEIVRKIILYWKKYFQYKELK